MTFDDIRFALGVNGVEVEDIDTLIAFCKTEGTHYEKLDDMLVQMGYEKVFTDEFFGWLDANDEDYNDDYYYSEKMPYRHEWDE